METIINLVVLLSLLVIPAGIVWITSRAARAKGGRKGNKTANQNAARIRHVNPKTGQLFP